ncbi:MAG: hypothetical protein ABJM29_08955 [Rhizobiaceae bacterium]
MSGLIVGQQFATGVNVQHLIGQLLPCVLVEELGALQTFRLALKSPWCPTLHSLAFNDSMRIFARLNNQQKNQKPFHVPALTASSATTIGALIPSNANEIAVSAT